MNRKLEIFGYLKKGYEGQIIKIETDIHSGFPGFEIIGLPDSAIRESRERVRSALRNSGFKFPQQTVLTSLSPASVPKQGSSLDLGIALSILFASGSKNSEEDSRPMRIMTSGELMLDGKVVQDCGCIGAIEAAKRLNCNLCIVPFPVAGEDCVINADKLISVFIQCGDLIHSSFNARPMSLCNAEKQSVFEDVIGLDKEKEIIAMSVSGFHSIMFFGPPGVGKTMLSNKIPMLLPDSDEKDREELARIYGSSVADAEYDNVPVSRIISHDCSLSQFVGGLNQKSPGLGALSHRGVVILDELTKYTPKLLEAVKDAYDKGFTISSKSGEEIKYPSKFITVANMNACPCGGLGSALGVCSCNGLKLENHWKKVGRPILERFDIRLPIEEIDLMSLCNSSAKKPDAYYIDKINISRERQKKRFADCGIKYNGELHYNPSYLKLFSKEMSLLSQMNVPVGILKNARMTMEILSVARTIADYNGRDDVSEEDFNLAFEYQRYGFGDYFWRTVR